MNAPTTALRFLFVRGLGICAACFAHLAAAATPRRSTTITLPFAR
jgi:hypothetical protein